MKYYVAIALVTYLFGQRLIVPLLAKLYPTVLFYRRRSLWTFDDVPRSRESFRALLDWLDRRGKKAVLFVISGQVTSETRPLLVEAIKSGHTLGNHGKTDSRHVSASLSDLEAEVGHCEELLQELYAEAGVVWKVKYYRPGGGFFNQSMITLVESRGYQMMLGSVYPYDPLIRWSWLNYWFIKLNLRSNDIVVLHDRPWTANLLAKL